MIKTPGGRPCWRLTAGIVSNYKLSDTKFKVRAFIDYDSWENA